MTVSAQSGRPAEAVDVFLVAGEESGDRLGAALMRALRERTAGQVRFSGVGGREMAAEGVTSLYSIDDLSIIGFSAIPRRIPKHPASDALYRQGCGGETPARPCRHR